MKIKRNFWNYGIMEWYNMYIPNNLCEYVRKLGFAYLVTTFFGIIATWLTVSPLWLLGAKLGFFYNFFFLENQTFIQAVVTAGATISLDLMVILSIFFVIFMIAEYRNKKHIERYLKGEEPKEKGIIRQWLSDRHNKICRPIDFEK